MVDNELDEMYEGICEQLGREQAVILPKGFELSYLPRPQTHVLLAENETPVCYENGTSVIDADGIPGRSIYMDEHLQEHRRMAERMGNDDWEMEGYEHPKAIGVHPELEVLVEKELATMEPAAQAGYVFAVEPADGEVRVLLFNPAHAEEYWLAVAATRLKQVAWNIIPDPYADSQNADGRAYLASRRANGYEEWFARPRLHHSEDLTKTKTAIVQMDCQHGGEFE